MINKNIVKKKKKINFLYKFMEKISKLKRKKIKVFQKVFDFLIRFPARCLNKNYFLILSNRLS